MLAKEKVRTFDGHGVWGAVRKRSERRSTTQVQNRDPSHSGKSRQAQHPTQVVSKEKEGTTRCRVGMKEILGLTGGFWFPFFFVSGVTIDF